MDDTRKIETVVGRIEASHTDITASYSDWMKIAFSLASLSEAGRSFFKRVSAMNPDYNEAECDRKYDNVLATSLGRCSIGTFYHLCQEHGIDISMPMGRPRTTEEEQKKGKAAKMQNAIDYINNHYQLRFNVWTNRTEMKEKGEWHPVTDRDMDTIYCELTLSGISLSKNDLISLLVSKTVVTEYDAVKIWLNGLPAWMPQDGDDIENEVFKDDPIAEFFSHIKIANEEERATCLHFMRRWFVGLVGMMTGMIDEHSLMLVLTGEQHKGKTYFVRHILPPELRDYLYQANPSTKVDKDFIISLSEFVLIFLDEFSFSNNAKSDACKYVVTSNFSNERDSYGHFRERRIRRAALIAATNETRFIKDIQGSRRYFPVETVGYVDFNEVPLNYERAYAMALYLLNHGYSPKPTAEESEFITKRNMDYLEPNDVAEVINTFFRQPMPGGECKALTAGQIKLELINMGFRSKEYNVVAIGRALTLLGYKAYPRHHQNMYLIVKRDFNQLEADSKYEGEKIREMIEAEQGQDE